MTTLVTPAFSLKRTALRYGTLAGGLMAGYFLLLDLLDLLGWQQQEAARFGSFLFVIVAVVLAIRAYWVKILRPVPYLSGLGLGLMVSLVGSLLYAAFIFSYASIVNAAHKKQLLAQTYFTIPVGPVMLAVTITLLGGIIGGLTGYTMMMANGPDDTEE